MARTQAADYDDKRSAIMHKAGQLFAKYGFAGASLSELATRCEVSKSVLYHYYASKEEILFAVMVTHMDALLEAIDLKIYNDLPKDQWFHELASQLLERYVGGANAQKVLLYDLDYLNAKDRDMIIARERQLIDFTEKCFLDAIAPSQPEPKTVKAQIMLFFGMINWSHSWFDPERGISREDLAKQAADSVVLPMKGVG